MIDWKERYMREVEGLNNEGDPIGGDPPSGLRHQVEALKAENEAQAKRIAELEAVLRIAKSEIDEASKSEGVLFGNDPLVCKKIEAVLEVLEESKLRQKFADKSTWTKLLKSKQDTKKDE